MVVIGAKWLPMWCNNHFFVIIYRGEAMNIFRVRTLPIFLAGSALNFQWDLQKAAGKYFKPLTINTNKD